MESSSSKAARQKEEILVGGGRTVVTRRGNRVYREAKPWSSATVALLKHLEGVSYPYSPRVIDTGFDESGRETLRYIEGETHMAPWEDDALPCVGKMLRELHTATASFTPSPTVFWREWYGRDIVGSHRVIGHCDTGPWNILSTGGLPIALIDWEQAGPVDAMFELAQACWLNAQLYDDDLAEKLKLGSALRRARQVRFLLDGYELPLRRRRGFVDALITCALLDAANEAIEAKVTEATLDPSSLWAITWRTRSAAWISRNRVILEGELTRN